MSNKSKLVTRFPFPSPNFISSLNSATALSERIPITSESSNSHLSAAAMGHPPKYRAHLVLIPMFSPSHSLPLFDFAFRLASLSIKVTIISSSYHVRQVWTNPLYWRTTPRLLAAGDSIDLVPVEDGIYDGTWEGFGKTVREVASEKKFVSVFGKHLELLMAMVPKPCCVVSDMLMGWTQELAKEFGIPRFVLHIQPASNLSLMLHVPNLIAKGRLPLTKENQTKPIPIPGFKFPLHPTDLVSELKDEKFIEMGAYDCFLRMSRRALEAPIVLVNTFRELEEDCFIAFQNLLSQAMTEHQVPKVIPIGPLLLPDDFPMPSAGVIVDEISEEIKTLMQWLNLQPPRSMLYIAFGSLVKNGLEQVQEIAFALESSKQPFLWLAGTPIKRPNEPPLPHVSELMPLGFEERTQKQGKVVTMVVPQIHILRHPACGAFLCHCGWNSVLESITSAVPIIAWPQQYEQRMTARYLIDTVKVAAELHEERTGFVGREEIQRVVRLVMHQAEGVAFHTQAAELKQLAAKYAYCNTHLDSFLDGLIR